MKVLSGIEKSDKSSVVTIGSFDGVHYGHRHILNTLFEKSKEYGAESVVLTLNPHPRKVLKLDLSKLYLLNSFQEKKHLLEKCGVSTLYVAEFNKQFSELSGEQYVKQYLVDRLNAKAVIIGYDHHFGKNRKYGYDFLSEMGNKYGFDLFEISKQDIDAANLSSTVIRNLLLQGDIKKANKYLCEPYFFISEIDENGALLIQEELKLIPPPGKYSAEISFGDIQKACELVISNDKTMRVETDIIVIGECLVKIVDKK